MLFSDINPYVRYARVLELTPRSLFSPVVAPDTRLLYTLSGKGSIAVQGQDYSMTENSLLIIGAGIPYHIQTPVSAVQYLAFNFDYTRRASQLSVPVQPCAVAVVTTAADGVYTAHVETDIGVSCCPAVGGRVITISIGGVGGTVSHVCSGVTRIA